MRALVAEEVQVRGLGQCPRCGSSDVLTMEAIAQNGMSVSASVASYSGFGVTNRGVVPVVGSSSVLQVHRSALAAATAPAPALRNWAGVALASSAYLLVWFPIFALVMVLSLSDGAKGGVSVEAQVVAALFGLMFAAPAALGFVVTARNVRFNARIRRGCPAAYQVWRHARYCVRCAGCFWPVSAPTGISTGQAVSPVEFQRAVWAAGAFASR